MASLDQILDRMTERGGKRLTLRVGQVPTVRSLGRDVPVQKVALTEDQVLTLARELAGPDDAVRIDRREPASFSYRGFDVRLSFPDTGACADIVPGDPLATDDQEPLPALDTSAQAVGAQPAAYPGRLAFELDEGNEPQPSIEVDAAAVPARAPARPPSSAVPGADVAAPAAPAMSGLRQPALPPSPGQAPTPPSLAALPGGFLDDIRSFFETRRARYVAVAVAGALGMTLLGGLLAWSRPPRVPNVVLADASGHPVTFQDMRGNQRRLLVVFLLPGCSMSRFAAETLKQAYPERSAKMAFVGLFFGTQAEAQQFGNDLQLPFPLYGLKDNKNPFLIQQLMKKVGTSDWMVSGIYGGTTIVLDDDNRVILELEKEGVRQLPQKLASLED